MRGYRSPRSGEIQGLDALKAQLPPYREAITGARRDYVRRALELAGGKVELAAMIAEVRRTDFYRFMDDAGIERKRRPNRRRAQSEVRP